MNNNKKNKKKLRIRNKLKKNSSRDRFRLTIFRSSKNIYAQIIDDVNKKTLVSSSSLDKKIKNESKEKKIDMSKIVAENLAAKAVEKKIKKIYLDRGLYRYHGRIKLFAETLRSKGLEF